MTEDGRTLDGSESNRLITGNQGAIINKMAVSRERKNGNGRISLQELQDGLFQPMEDTSGAPLHNP